MADSLPLPSPSPEQHSAFRLAGAVPNSSNELCATLSQVTHDINNPLTVISGNAQYLLELVKDLDLAPDVAEPVGEIEEACQRLKAMIGRLSALNEQVQQDTGRFGGDGV